MTRSGKFLVVGAWTLLWPLYVHGATALSDRDIRQHLIGSWIVPPESSDYQPDMSQVLETFDADGSETLVIFRDRECKTVLQKIESKWRVNGGVLITNYADGREDRDDVLSITTKELKLHSRTDGTDYIRAKASTCGNNDL